MTITKENHWSNRPDREDIRLRISNSLKGNIPWNKGKKGWFPHDKSPLKPGHTPWNKGVHVQTNTGKTHFKKGQKPSHWKGGISSIQSRIYAHHKTKLWREIIFKRDNFSCQKCGFHGDLHSHHIIPVKELLKRVMIDGLSNDDKFNLALSIPELFDPENGLTLCRSCHRSIHKKENKMKKALFLLLALLSLSIASLGQAAGIPATVTPLEGPETWIKEVYNASGSTLNAGDVVVWDAVNSSGSNDNWVRHTTTADTWIVAGVVYPKAIAPNTTGSIAFHGVVDVTVTGAIVGDAGLCSSSTAGSARSCGSGSSTTTGQFGFALETGTSTSITSYLTL